MRTFSQSVSTRLLSSLQVYKVPSLSVSNTVTEATGFRSYQPVSTSTHVQSHAIHHVAQYRPSTFRTRRDSASCRKNTFSTNTLFGDDVRNDSISVECPPPVDACSQRATKRDNAHQRHTRSVQSSLCAEGGISSQIQSVSVRGLQPKRAVLQRCCSRPLSSRCCSILSAIRTATRCSSAFQFDVLPEPRSTSAFEVCCSRPLSAKRPSPRSRRSFPPGSARPDIPFHCFKTFLSSSMGWDLNTAFTTAARPSLAVETSPCPLVYRSLSKVVKTFSLSPS